LVSSSELFLCRWGEPRSGNREARCPVVVTEPNPLDALVELLLVEGLVRPREGVRRSLVRLRRRVEARPVGLPGKLTHFARRFREAGGR